MNDIKRILFIIPLLLILVVLPSCGSLPEKIQRVNKPEVDFSFKRNVQCEYNSDITDVTVKNGDNGIEIVYTPLNEKSEEQIETLILNGVCSLKFNDIEYSRDISYFGDDFLPQIISTFITQTDFELCEYEFNGELNEHIFSSTVCNKFVELHLTKNVNNDDYIYSFKII